MASTKVSFLTRLYIWSIVFEPLLFFVFASRLSTGVGGNISRVFQLLVILILLGKLLLSSGKVIIPKPFNPIFKNYTYYFLLALLSGIIGYFQNSYTINIYLTNKMELSGIAGLFNSSSFRPFFEYIVTIYYFIYFCVFPVYLIKTDEGISYFFRMFYRVFILCLILGYVDLIFSFLGQGILPRHILDGVFVGPRFHGLAGEPRDAFVYLVLSLAILNLYKYWNNRGFIESKWIILIFITMLLTQSASGLIGLLFAAGLIIIFSNFSWSIKSFIQLSLITLTLLITIYIGVINSTRLMAYIEVFPQLEETLKYKDLVPATFLGQMTNIYPLWDFYTNIINFNLVPVLIGKGLGSSSIINSNLFDVNDIMNPNSEIVRLIYESGIIGTGVFTFAFISPVRLLITRIPANDQKWFIIIVLLLIGVFMSHRSSAIFIYLGILILVMKKINLGQDYPVPSK